MTNAKLEPTIGLEIHVELRTDSKMFCGCPGDHFGKAPNTQTCPVCLGLPGALPVPNKKAIDRTILMGLALHSKINKQSKFDRKHYFYPDLPKGYQISQYDEPFCVGGYIDTSEGRVGITRVHLEEDTGKLQHTTLDGERVSLVDFNRSGVPLVEIVTEPEIHSGTQAKEYAQKLQQIVRFLEISDADMEKGSMRLEANISWGLHLGYKVEVKNLNSFRFVERAINYELAKQKEELDRGETPRQETKGWSEVYNKTVSQRFKETAADYRYFPEPDIPPFEFTDTFIESVKKTLPKLPNDIKTEFIEKYKIKESFAEILISTKELAKFAEESFVLARKENISVFDIAAAIVNQKVDYQRIKPNELISKVKEKKSEKIDDVKQINEWVSEAVKENQKAYEDYKNGKVQAIATIIGAVMKLSRGKANPSIVKELIEKNI